MQRTPLKWKSSASPTGGNEPVSGDCGPGTLLLHRSLLYALEAEHGVDASALRDLARRLLERG